MQENQPPRRPIWSEVIRRFWQGGLELVFPPARTCVVCGKRLAPRALVALCSLCLGRLRLVGQQFCHSCGRPRPGQGDYCRDCTDYRHFFVKNRALAVYEGALREMIGEIKYRYNRSLALALGEVLGLAAARMEWVPAHALLVAVPLHPGRLRRRGYNQAQLLAAGVSRHLVRKVLNPGTITRRGATSASNPLSPRERRLNLRGAFQVARPTAVAGKVLCVVDDIYTTGATLDELARTLLYAGAQEVHAITLAIAVADQDFRTIPAGADSGGGKAVQEKVGWALR